MLNLFQHVYPFALVFSLNFVPPFLGRGEGSIRVLLHILTSQYTVILNIFQNLYPFALAKFMAVAFGLPPHPTPLLKERVNLLSSCSQGEGMCRVPSPKGEG